MGVKETRAGTQKVHLGPSPLGQATFGVVGPPGVLPQQSSSNQDLPNLVSSLLRKGADGGPGISPGEPHEVQRHLHPGNPDAANDIVVDGTDLLLEASRLGASACLVRPEEFP